MNVADLIPAGRRPPAAAGEPPPETPDTADSPSGRPQPEASFAEVLAEAAVAASRPAPGVDAIDSAPAESADPAAAEPMDAAAPPDDEPAVEAAAVPQDPVQVPDPDVPPLAADAVALGDAPALGTAAPRSLAAATPVPESAMPVPRGETGGIGGDEAPGPSATAMRQAPAVAAPPPTPAPPAEAAPSTQVDAGQAEPTARETPDRTTSLPAATPPAPAVLAPPVAGSAVASIESPAGLGWRLEAGPVETVPARAEPSPSPAAPPPVGRQIAAAVARAADGQVEIRLDPPELGRVQIRLETGDDGLRAVVLAERPETQDLLRRNADQLARDLGAAGYERVSLDFSAGGNAAARREDRALRFAAAGQGIAPADAPADAARRPTAAGGLDIRL